MIAVREYQKKVLVTEARAFFRSRIMLHPELHESGRNRSLDTRPLGLAILFPFSCGLVDSSTVEPDAALSNILT